MNYRKQKGFTLLELVLVMAVVGFMMIIEMEKKSNEINQLEARNLGIELYRYSKGVQGYISYHSGDIDSVFGVGATVGDTVTKSGTSWLKEATCLNEVGAPKGTADSAFVSCDFLDMRGGTSTSFGSLPLKTKLTYRTEGEIVATTVLDGLSINGEFAGSLSGLAALVASGASSISSTDTTVFTAEADIFYCVTGEGPKCGDNGTGVSYSDKIVIKNSADSATDYWLRTDHGNNMSSAIEFDSNSNDINATWGNGFSVRQIKNVARIYNEGITGNDSLILGKEMVDAAAIIASTAGVIVDADQDILGELNVAKDIKTQGNIIAEENITAGIDLTVKRNAIVEQDLTVYSDQTVGGNSYLNGKIVGPDTGDVDNRYIYIDGLVDYDDNTYKVDPNGSSVLNDLKVGNYLESNALTVTGTTKLKLGSYVYNLDDLIPKAILKTIYVAQDGSNIPIAACPAGMYNKVVVTPAMSHIESRSTAGGRYGGQFIARAVKSGSRYYIYVRSTWYAYGGTGVGIVTQYCKR